MKHTQHEDAYFVQLQGARLPLPQREYTFYPGRRFRADFDWVRGHHIPLLVEIEGSLWGTGKRGTAYGKNPITGRHLTPQGFRRDCEKYNLAVSLGLYVLRFTPDMIEDGSALSMTELVLQRLHLQHAA